MMINGPINAVEMEGYVNGIKKRIVFMMDVHISVNHQTECPDIYAEDVRNYLLKLFKKKSNTTFDFFFEITPYQLRSWKVNEEKNIYISNIEKLFKKLYYNNTFPNLRLHYVDIRHVIPGIYKNGNTNDHIVDELTKYSHYLLKLFDMLYENKEERTKKEKSTKKRTVLKYKQVKFKKRKIAHILNKIRNKYENNNVKDKINEYVDTEIKNFILSLIEKIKDVLKYVPEHYNSVIFVEKPFPNYEYVELSKMGFLEKLEYINEYYQYVRLFITDLYLLRKFLEKNYITTTVSYNGAFHSVHCIYVLMKYFDFKIIKQAHGKINKNINLDGGLINIMLDVGKNFYPKLPVQCCDMSGFFQNL